MIVVIICSMVGVLILNAILLGIIGMTAYDAGFKDGKRRGNVDARLDNIIIELGKFQQKQMQKDITDKQLARLAIEKLISEC